MRTKKYKNRINISTLKERSFLDQPFSKRLTKRLRKGGSVIASGGFGCIFNPAIKCKNITNKTNKTNITNKTNKNINMVSKLMKTKHAKNEYKEITKFKPLLQKIPNYENFFLIEGFSICQPTTLSNTDLQNFNKKCSALKKMDIDENNINKHLNKLMALNMPFGGIDIDEFIENNATNINLMKSLNNCLINLLEKGIIPMNRLGVFHCDLKSSNILVNQEDTGLTTKIIDWGLSTTYKPNNPIPDILLRRPLQYNVPFSNILFNSTFHKMYSIFLNKLKNDNKQQTYNNTYTFTINYILEWINERGQGHIKTISKLYSIIFDHPNIDLNVSKLHIKYEIAFHYIFKYITEILMTFTHDGDFDTIQYFNQVFMKNVDIWGLVLSYIPFLEYIHEFPNNSIQKINKYFKGLIMILLNSSDKPIPIKFLTNTLTHFNKIIYYYKHNLSVSSINSTSESALSHSHSQSRSHSHEIIESDKHLSNTEKRKKRKSEHIFIVKTLKNIISDHQSKQQV